MKLFNLLFLAVLALSLSACAPKFVSKNQAYPEVYNEDPVAVLVLPPINQTTAAEAKEYYDTTIAEPLTLNGYYVFPLEVVEDLLEAEGVVATEDLLAVDPQHFKENFGADAVLFIVLNKWDTSYYVIGGNVTVGISYILKSTEDGETIWHYTNTVTIDTSGGNHGGGLAGLIVSLAETAIKTAMTDYVPIAKRVNNIAMVTMPAGKYHPRFDQDQNDQVVPEAIIKAQNTLDAQNAQN